MNIVQPLPPSDVLWLLSGYRRSHPGPIYSPTFMVAGVRVRFCVAEQRNVYVEFLLGDDALAPGDEMRGRRVVTTASLTVVRPSNIYSRQYDNEAYFRPIRSTGFSKFVVTAASPAALFSDVVPRLDGDVGFRLRFKSVKLGGREEAAASSRTSDMTSDTSSAGFSEEGGPPPYPGLINQGATCYLNSAIQMLYHIPLLRQVVMDLPLSGPAAERHQAVVALKSLFYEMSSGLEIAAALRETLSSMPSDVSDPAAPARMKKLPSISTGPLTRAFGWEGEDAFQQHDVGEFLMLLFEKLDAAIRDTAVDVPKNFIEKTFYLRTAEYLKCLDISYGASRPGAYLSPVIPVQGCETLYDGIRSFLTPSLMLGEAGIRLSPADAPGAEPGQRYDFYKGVRIANLPPVLFLTLERFSFDSSTFRMAKINQRLEFPEVLDMSLFSGEMLDSLERDFLENRLSTERRDSMYIESYATVGAAQKRDRGFSRTYSSMVAAAARKALPIDPSPKSYVLHSVLCHLGGAESGHYYAIVAPRVYDPAGEFQAAFPTAATAATTSATSAASTAASGSDTAMSTRSVRAPSSYFTTNLSASHYVMFNDKKVKAVGREELAATFGTGRAGPAPTAYILVYFRSDMVSTLFAQHPVHLPQDLKASLLEAALAHKVAEAEYYRRKNCVAIVACTAEQFKQMRGFGLVDARAIAPAVEKALKYGPGEGAGKAVPGLGGALSGPGAHGMQDARGDQGAQGAQGASAAPNDVSAFSTLPGASAFPAQPIDQFNLSSPFSHRSHSRSQLPPPYQSISIVPRSRGLDFAREVPDPTVSSLFAVTVSYNKVVGIDDALYHTAIEQGEIDLFQFYNPITTVLPRHSLYNVVFVAPHLSSNRQIVLFIKCFINLEHLGSFVPHIGLEKVGERTFRAARRRASSLSHKAERALEMAKVGTMMQLQPPQANTGSRSLHKITVHPMLGGINCPEAAGLILAGDVLVADNERKLMDLTPVLTGIYLDVLLRLLTELFPREFGSEEGIAAATQKFRTDVQASDSGLTLYLERDQSSTTILDRRTRVGGLPNGSIIVVELNTDSQVRKERKQAALLLKQNYASLVTEADVFTGLGPTSDDVDAYTRHLSALEQSQQESQSESLSESQPEVPAESPGGPRHGAQQPALPDGQTSQALRLSQPAGASQSSRWTRPATKNSALQKAQQRVPFPRSYLSLIAQRASTVIVIARPMKDSDFLLGVGMALRVFFTSIADLRMSVFDWIIKYRLGLPQDTELEEIPIQDVAFECRLTDSVASVSRRLAGLVMRMPCLREVSRRDPAERLAPSSQAPGGALVGSVAGTAAAAAGGAGTASGNTASTVPAASTTASASSSAPLPIPASSPASVSASLVPTVSSPVPASAQAQLSASASLSTSTSSETPQSEGQAQLQGQGRVYTFADIYAALYFDYVCRSQDLYVKTVLKDDAILPSKLHIDIPFYDASAKSTDAYVHLFNDYEVNGMRMTQGRNSLDIVPFFTRRPDFSKMQVEKDDESLGEMRTLLTLGNVLTNSVDTQIPQDLLIDGPPGSDSSSDYGLGLWQQAVGPVALAPEQGYGQHQGRPRGEPAEVPYDPVYTRATSSSYFVLPSANSRFPPSDSNKQGTAQKAGRGRPGQEVDRVQSLLFHYRLVLTDIQNQGLIRLCRVVVFLHSLPVRDVAIPMPRVASSQTVAVLRDQLHHRLDRLIDAVSGSLLGAGERGETLQASRPPGGPPVLSLAGRLGLRARGQRAEAQAPPAAQQAASGQEGPRGPSSIDLLLTVMDLNGRVLRPINNPEETLSAIRGNPPLPDVVYRCDILPGYDGGNRFVVLHHMDQKRVKASPAKPPAQPASLIHHSRYTPVAECVDGPDSLLCGYPAIINMPEGAPLTRDAILGALAESYEKYAALQTALRDMGSPEREALERNSDGSWPIYRGRDYTIHSHVSVPAREEVTAWKLVAFDKGVHNLAQASCKYVQRGEEVEEGLFTRGLLAAEHALVQGWKLHPDTAAVVRERAPASRRKELSLG